MPSPEALLYVAPLLHGIEDKLDDYICGNADEPGVGVHNFRWCGRYAGGRVGFQIIDARYSSNLLDI